MIALMLKEKTPVTTEPVVDFFIFFAVSSIHKGVAASLDCILKRGPQIRNIAWHGANKFPTHPSFSQSTKELFKYTFACFGKLTDLPLNI